MAQLRLDYIETTDLHRAGFARKHELEVHEHSIEKVAEGFLVRELLTRETHTLVTPDLGEFVFDVTSIKKLLARDRIPYQMIRAHLSQEWADYIFKSGGCEEAGIARLTVEDLDRPGIMIDFRLGRTATIDGNHRLVRSWREKRSTYDLAFVRVEEIMPHMCRPGDEGGMMEEARRLEGQISGN